MSNFKKRDFFKKCRRQKQFLWEKLGNNSGKIQFLFIVLAIPLDLFGLFIGIKQIGFCPKSASRQLKKYIVRVPECAHTPDTNRG